MDARWYSSNSRSIILSLSYILPEQVALRNALSTPLVYDLHLHLSFAHGLTLVCSIQGVLIQNKKEAMLVYDITRNDTHFQYTTVSCRQTHGNLSQNG